MRSTGKRPIKRLYRRELVFVPMPSPKGDPWGHRALSSVLPTHVEEVHQPDGLSGVEVFRGECRMASENLKDTSPTLSVSEAEEMTKYGITRVPVDSFYCRQFRHTNLEDAIAQSKRDHERMD
jgi:hypothetical protein